MVLCDAAHQKGGQSGTNTENKENCLSFFQL